MIDEYNKIYKFGVNGWFNFSELYDMICEKYEEGPFVEIGVWQGMSLAYLMLKAKHDNVWGVDTFKGCPNNPGEQNLIRSQNLDLEKNTRENLAKLKLTPKLLVMESVEGASHFKDGECSFVYVDGGHSYKQVKADLQAWYPKVKFGGIIAGHDYPADGVKRAVNEFFGEKSITTKGDYWWIER